MKACHILRVLFSLAVFCVFSAHAENNEAIFVAIKQGDSAAVEKYLTTSGDINARNSRESTLIMIAASHRRYDLVQLLKKHGADLNLVNRDGSGLLHYYIEGFKRQDKLAAMTGVEVKPVLEELKILPYIANNDGDTPLHEAALSPSMPASVVAVLITMQKDMNVVNKRGESVVHEAALVHLPALVKAGAKIDVKNLYGETPLGEAIELNNTEKAKYLVEHGADLKQVTDHDGNTAIMMTNKLDLIDWFLNHGADASIKNHKHRTALQDFLDDQYYREENRDVFMRVLERLVLANPDLDYQYDQTQAPALLEASENGNMVAVRYLIAKGASVKVGSNRDTVLTALSRGGSNYYSLEDVRFLVDAGADTNGVDADGSTPLMLFMQSAKIEQPHRIAFWLVEQGADINHRNKDGKTPLMNAVEARNPELVNVLLAKGADVNARDRDGMTPILYACCDEESFPMARALIEQGANAADYSNSNRSLQLRKATEEQVRYYLDHGYNPNIREKGVSPGAALDRYDDEPFAALLKSRGALHDIEIMKLEEQAYRAIEKGDMKALKNTLSAGYFVNNIGYEKLYSGAPSFNSNGERTLLAAAIIYKQPEMVRFLLEQDANPSRAMPAVMESGNLEMLKLLVEKGADINYSFSINSKSLSRWPLYYAIEHKQTEMARYLIEKGARVDMAPDMAYVVHMPLYAAIKAGDTDMAELLITHGATVQDSNLLVEAYESGQVEIAELLRSKGLVIPEALYTVTGKEQTTEEYVYAINNRSAPGASTEKAVQNAIRYHDLSQLNKFVESGYVFRLKSEKEYEWSGDWHNLGSAIHQAAAGHATDVLRYIDEQSGMQLGITPAMLAASDGDLETLKKTVTKENLEAKNTFGTTAFYISMLAHCEPCALYLLEQGADVHVHPNYTFDDDSQALLMAARWSLPLTQAIMAHDREHKMAYPELYSEAMMAAVEATRMDIALALKKDGATFNEHRGLKYPSVLIDAIRENNIERVKQMLNVGADPNKVTATAYGPYTALAVAFMSNHSEIADLLLEHRLKNDKPSPALQLAAEAMLHTHRNDGLTKLFTHPEVLDLDKLFMTAVESRNADGVKLVMQLAKKQHHPLKEFDREKSDLQNRADQWKDEKHIQTQVDRDRILNVLAVMN
jgi:ankyrin repeat protein